MQVKKYLQGFIAGAATITMVFVASPDIAQKIRSVQTGQAAEQARPGNIDNAYENQSIAAVRSIKPAIVDIVGNSSVSEDSISMIAGTGFVIGSDGLIVSNSHVVQDTNIKYAVVFADGTQHDATVVGLDKFDDVALLKINANNLPVAKLGDSGRLETGQTVFTIGNSLGKYQNSVTRGVVSGLGRAINVGADSNLPVPAPAPRLQNLIQTDAAINVGNSGGPLIDLKGEVVGMNTLIDVQGQGLGFAIPINTVKDAVDQLQKYGKVSKPYLGINFLTIDKAVQAIRKLEASDGAYIASVIPDGPADKAGIRPGDIITHINRDKLTQANELDMAVNKFKTGDKITVTLQRDGKQQDVELTLGEFK